MMERFFTAALTCIAMVTSSGCAAITAIGLGTERGRADLREHIDADGIHYLERAPDDAVGTVVMVHGFGGSKDHWTRMCAQMPDRLRIIALDLPGFGESPRIETEVYDMEHQVPRLERFLAGHHVERAHFFGSSMGGKLVTLYALTHPKRVESLVLFDPSGVKSPIESESARRERERGGTPLIARTPEEFDELMKLNLEKPPKIPGFIKQYFVDQGIQNAAFTTKIFQEIRSGNPADAIEERLGEIDVPVLVVWGDKDRVIHPSAAPIWGEKLKHGDVVVMKDTGHAPMLERPSESAALVAVWWQRRGFFAHRP